MSVGVVWLLSIYFDCTVIQGMEGKEVFIN